MKRLAFCLASCVLACLLLSGCGGLPEAREPEDTELMRVLGVDYTDQGVTLTAASGTQGLENKEPVVLSVSGATTEDAITALGGAGEGYASLVYVTQIILGADTPAEKVLSDAIEEKQMGQTATVWVTASGTAQALIEKTKGGVDRLASIEVNTDVRKLTVLEALAELCEKREIQIPQLTVENDKLMTKDYATVREGGLG